MKTILNFLKNGTTESSTRFNWLLGGITGTVLIAFIVIQYVLVTKMTSSDVAILISSIIGYIITLATTKVQQSKIEKDKTELDKNNTI